LPLYVHILKLKCTKFDFVWGCAPDLAGGAYSALPDPLSGLKGDILLRGRREGEGKGKQKREKEGNKRGKGKGSGGGRGSP